MNVMTEPNSVKPRLGFSLGMNIVLVFLAGVAAERLVFSKVAASKRTLDQGLIAQAYTTIQRNYVDRSALNPKELTYGAINGMVDALGDTGHSTLLTPEMVKKVKAESEGKLTGIGVEIQLKAGHVVVVSPMDNSPAQRAGLRPGDVILRVYGEEITGWPISRVAERITGPPGTPVLITILEPRSGQTRDLTLIRAELKLRSLTWRQLPGSEIAHVRIASFDQGLGKELRKALLEIKRSNLEGLILDLRNNPGGLLNEAVKVASEFMEGGNVVLVKDSDRKITPIPAEKDPTLTAMRMVVLINAGSASGAEIVAGALKDARRAKLIGETTFGTGTVLTQFPLRDGSALLLAIEEWLTPNGQSFWHKGIAPHITVTLPADEIPLTPDREAKLNAEELRASGDHQLLRALQELTGAQKAANAKVN